MTGLRRIAAWWHARTARPSPLAAALDPYAADPDADMAAEKAAAAAEVADYELWYRQ